VWRHEPYTLVSLVPGQETLILTLDHIGQITTTKNGVEDYDVEVLSWASHALVPFASFSISPYRPNHDHWAAAISEPHAMPLPADLCAQPAIFVDISE
jgi:hypothetical protein